MTTSIVINIVEVVTVNRRKNIAQTKKVAVPDQ